MVPTDLQLQTQVAHLIFKFSGSKKQQLVPLESKPTGEDILNAILPPREWIESGKHHM